MIVTERRSLPTEPILTKDSRLFSRWAAVPFWVLVGAYLVFLFTLDSFPSQDGPVHTYYADVLRDLLTGGRAYGQYFQIHHVLPPYALIYYLLMALGTVFPPLVAERILLGIYTLLLAFGFRFLLRVLNPNATFMAVCVFPFIFNKFVYLGFFNFDLGVALAMIVSAFWLRDFDALSGWKRWRFLALIALLLMTHAIALFVVILLCGGHLLFAVIRSVRNAGGGGWPGVVARLRAPIVSLALACCLALYVLLFVADARSTVFPTLAQAFTKAGKLVLLGPISPFQHWYYAAPLGFLLLCASFSAVILSARCGLSWSFNQLVLVAIAALCAFLYVIAPETFSGGWGFDQRFPIFGVLFFLAAVASNRVFELRGPAMGIIAVAVVIGAGTLVYQLEVCRRYQIAGDLYRLPAMSEGSAGAVVMESTALYQPAGLAFSPYRWVGAYYMLKSKSGFLNAPFLHTSTMPLLVRPNLRPADPVGMERMLLSPNPGVTPDFLVFIGDTDHLAPGNRLDQLVERYGFAKKSSTSVTSVFTRSASAARGATREKGF